MEKEYDDITSYYYQKYRPALHPIILNKCLSSEESFKRGLDIGCGTGHSTIALCKYCEKVIGVEPSIQMLENAISHPQVEYQLLQSEEFQFEDKSFDIVTLAGSLYYAKSQKLLDEITRLGIKKSLIVVYDFKIELNPIMEFLTNNSKLKIEQNYNHEENFSGLDDQKISIIQSKKENISLEISNRNFIALLLSSKENLNLLANKYGIEKLEDKLISKLNHSNLPLGKNSPATIYYTVYQIT